MNFDLGWHDVVGAIGVSLIAWTYLMLQLGRMPADRPLFPALNGIGAVLILVSLMYTFNFASFVIELFWLVVSGIGLARALSKRVDD